MIFLIVLIGCFLFLHHIGDIAEAMGTQAGLSSHGQDNCKPWHILVLGAFLVAFLLILGQYDMVPYMAGLFFVGWVLASIGRYL
jgi:hypothetical protein